MLITLLRKLLFWGVIWPLLWIVTGIWVRGRIKIPTKGPALIYANHNSHLDIFVIMAVCWGSIRHKVRPVAAADYFFSHPVLAWLSINLLRLIPMNRKGGSVRGSFDECNKALANGDFVILFPEGKRGEPEVLEELKGGLALIAKQNPTVPLIPMWIYGLGKTLPRDEGLIVPFVCDVYVGDPFYYQGDRAEFMVTATNNLLALRPPRKTVDWD